MKKFIACLAFLLAGCSLAAKPVNLDITPSSKKIVPMKDEYVNPNDADDSYGIVSLEGRDYIIYGVAEGKITGEMIGPCVAYSAEDEKDRYYSVNGTDDYIANYCESGMMDGYVFLRAVDTVGKEVETPSFIHSNDYRIWN